MHRLFIMGSCVSRDAFEYLDKNAFSLIEYFARSSLGSSFSGLAAKDVYSSRIPSAFQRKQIENDLLKTLPLRLARGDFDTLLVDFIDERFPLFRFRDGSIATVSVELHQLNALTSADGVKISEFSDEHFFHWRNGWRTFIEIAERGQFVNKVVINKAYWASRTVSEGGPPSIEQSAISTANRYLEKLYRVCSETLSERQFISYDENMFLSDPAHKWGLAPFHYTSPFYERTREFMEARSLMAP